MNKYEGDSMEYTEYNVRPADWANGLEIGLYTAGDYLMNPHTSKRIKPEERIHEIIRIAQLAEDAGVDIFQIGEAHQDNYISQSQMTILASIASITNRIKLSTAATVISTADPVRVFEDAATIDLISKGRMELVCGRSQRIGIFKLFGYALDDYEELFEEKFNLLLDINKQSHVTWTGQFRPALNKQAILPRPYRQEQLPIYRAIRGTMSSLQDAGEKGVPIYYGQLDGSLKKND